MADILDSTNMPADDAAQTPQGAPASDPSATPSLNQYVEDLEKAEPALAGLKADESFVVPEVPVPEPAAMPAEPPPPPISDKPIHTKGPNKTVIALIALFFMATTGLVFVFVNQKNQIGDIRNRAAALYPNQTICYNDCIADKNSTAYCTELCTNPVGTCNGACTAGLCSEIGLTVGSGVCADTTQYCCQAKPTAGPKTCSGENENPTDTGLACCDGMIRTQGQGSTQNPTGACHTPTGTYCPAPYGSVMAPDGNLCNCPNKPTGCVGSPVLTPTLSAECAGVKCTPGQGCTLGSNPPAGCWISHYRCAAGSVASGQSCDSRNGVLLTPNNDATSATFANCGVEQIDIYCPACGITNNSVPGTFVSNFSENNNCGGGGGGNTPTDTPNDTPTSTPIVAQCNDIKVYKGGVVVVPSTLRPGDAIVIAITGGNATKAHARVNGGAWMETSTKNTAGEYTTNYTIPTDGTTNFTIESEIYGLDGAWH